MSTLTSVILGIVQGLTEFIPVSSSGHLILVRDILGLPLSGSLAFDAVLQLATALSILVYFRKDFLDMAKSILQGRSTMLLRALIIGTIPAVVLGFLLEDMMDTIFRSSLVVAGSLVAGSALMWAGERWGRSEEDLTPKRGLIVGLFQSLALIPGLSRSGATISGGMLSGLSRESATRFAFLLGFPVLFGSGIKKLFDIGVSGMTPDLMLGSLFAFLVGLGAIHILISFVKRHSLMVFVWYRLLLAAVVVVYVLL